MKSEIQSFIQDSYGPQTSAAYDQMAYDLFWAYGDLLQTVAAEVNFARRSNSDEPRLFREMLDLGIGTGNLSKTILEYQAISRNFQKPGVPDSGPIQWHGFDASISMLEKAQSKLSDFPQIQFRPAVGRLQELSQYFSPSQMSCVFSSFAIHHLDAKEKQNLIRDCFNLLEPGGLLVIADKMTSETLGGGPAHDHRVMCSRFGTLFRSSPGKLRYSELCDEIERQFEADGDQPSSIDEHLSWMRAQGFIRVHCVYWNAGSAIISGEKPV